MNTDYDVVIYREDDYWVAEAVGCIGCATHADTREEALAKITELIPIWVESTLRMKGSVPEPRRHPAGV